jgi:hypothetical protein
MGCFSYVTLHEVRPDVVMRQTLNNVLSSPVNGVLT